MAGVFDGCIGCDPRKDSLFPGETIGILCPDCREALELGRAVNEMKRGQEIRFRRYADGFQVTVSGFDFIGSGYETHQSHGETPLAALRAALKEKKNG